MRLQWLQDISEEDCWAEGLLPRADNGMFQVDDRSFMTGRGAYMALWESLHGEGAWDDNPEGIAFAFRVHHCNVDDLIKQKTA